MNRRTSVVVWVVALVPASAVAQTIDGSAEWSVARNVGTTNGQSNENSSFWQNYALGYSSALFDPRIVKFDGQGLFRTNSLGAGGTTQPDQEGHQGDIGYKVGLSLFPASVFPFYFQALRTTSDSSGDLGPSNPIRSGMIAPTGAPPLDFQSHNRALSLGWRLGMENLPQVDLQYRRGQSIVEGGGYRSEQDDGDLNASVTKDTTRVRQSLRYQRTSFTNVLSQVFDQRLNNLDYDLNLSATAHTRFTAHGGQRDTFSRSQFAPIIDNPGGPYVPPPSINNASARYAFGSYSYEPSGRFTFRFSGNFDEQATDLATTTAALGTATTSAEVVRGLTLSGTGIWGTRGQMVGPRPVTVLTRSGVAGVTYQAGVKWLSGTASLTRGAGSNSTPEGLTGSTESWSREATLSSTFGWLGLGAGYERILNRDAILDYGNYDSERVRASVDTLGRTASISASAEQLRIERGVGLTFAANLQKTFSSSASLRLWRQSQVTAAAGGLVNDYASGVGIGRDRALYWSVGVQMMPASRLHAAGWIRSEFASASRTGYTQDGLSALGRVEYRLRAFSVAAEYRHAASLMQYRLTPNPADDFRGHQFRASIIRQFGMRLR